MKKIIALHLLLFTAIICHAQSVSLSLHLVKGETYYQNSNLITTVTQTVNGQKTPVTTTTNSRIGFKVTGIRDSLYDMEMRYEKLTLKIAIPPSTFTSYDADNASGSDPISAMFAAFKDQPIMLVINKTGRLQSVKGFDEIIDKVTGKFPGLQPDQKAQIKTMLGQSFGENGFRNTFETATPVFPAAPVKKGSVWNANFVLASVRPVKVHLAYELKDIAATTCTIHLDSKLDFMNKDVFEDNAGMPTKYTLNGTIATDIAVDKATGWIKKCTVNQTIEGTTEMKADQFKVTGIVIPMTSTTEGVVTGDK